MNKVRACLALVAGLILGGCTTHVIYNHASTSSAKTLPDGESAFIETYPSTWLLSIDDEPMSAAWHWGGTTQVLVTKVTPGEHVLMLREVTSQGSTREPVPLHISVRKGRRYSVYPVSPTYSFHDGDAVSFKMDELYSNTEAAKQGG